MAIKWDPTKMATGYADVDAQHQEWIRRFNQFDESIQKARPISELPIPDDV